MKLRAVGFVLLLVISAGARAAEEAESAPSAAEERVEEIGRLVEAARYEEAVTAARNLLRGTRDEAARTGAMRHLAVALRKSRQWKIAAKAYADLAGRFAEESDEAILAAATAEVLRDSPSGVYPPAKLDSEDPRTLADDAYRKAALSALAEKRMAAFKPRITAMHRARDPKVVIAALDEVAETFRRARVLDLDVSTDLAAEAVKTAADRLETIDRETLPKLREAVSAMDRTASQRGTLSNTDREHLRQIEETCRKVAEAEETFRAALAQLRPALEGRPTMRYGRDSHKRAIQYGHLAVRCRAIHNRATRWRD